MASNTTNRYRPKKFADPELDIALKTIFDIHYTLDDQAIIGVVTRNQALASGSTMVTGSQNSVVTGLATVGNVIASIDSEGNPLNEFVSVRPTPRGKGLIDISVWTVAAAPSVTPRLIRWFAIGDRVQ